MKYREDTITKSSKLFDEKFASIDELTWLPWIGCKYQKSENNLQSEKKILIVGESYYYNNHDNGKKQEEDDGKKQEEDIFWTRRVIKKYAINDDYKLKRNTFGNLLCALLGFVPQSTQSIWESIAFFNLIQRPMNYKKYKKDKGDQREHPSRDDFRTGWKVFSEVVKIIRPDSCIFIGVTASKYFDDSMKKFNVEHSSVKKLDKISKSRTRGRTFSMKVDNYNLPIIAIQHTGAYFSWTNFIKFFD